MTRDWDSGLTRGSAPTETLSLADVVQRFETLTTKLYTDGVKELGWQRYNRRVWQRNYWEHVVRSEETLNKIRHYIDANPVGWDADEENPAVFARRAR